MPNSIRVSKYKIIQSLKANKENHIKQYEEGFKIWLEKAKSKIAKIKEQLESPDAKDTVLDVNWSLYKPICYVDSYDKTIRMFELELRDEIDITTGDYETYFEDNWGEGWFSANPGYSGLVTKHPLEDWSALATYKFPDPNKLSRIP